MPIPNVLGAIKDKLKAKPQAEADISTDSFGADEQKKIVEMVISDITADIVVQSDWKEKLKKSLQHKHAEKPSIIEGTNKKAWQSDRNMGIGPATADTYQSTLFATCWNPDSIHFVATEENDIDNKDNLERFSKWMVGPNEANVTPEVDDFIQNKIDQGFSIFEIYREVWFDWVDRRIPNKGKDGRPNGTYATKTEKVRFEKAVIENVDNLDDILFPRYGDQIQKLPHIIRIVHLTGDKILEYGKSGQFMNVDKEMVENFKGGSISEDGESIERVKGDYLGLDNVVDDEFRALPIDVYKWYGWYTKNAKRERYRFLIERKTGTLLSGKPLRKIMRIPKYPFVGGPFERVAGELRGVDLYTMIADPVNAFNKTWNQKADYQDITNCPFGFHKAGEGYTKSVYDLEPGVSYPVEGNPNDDIFFPNIQRSMAWAEQDMRIVFEVIEKRTGAASYFTTTERNVSGTATRDKLVKEASDTRFGKWVTRIQGEIAEAITMLLSIYQDHIPDNLAQRVLGEDGKRLFPNLSIETLRYNADAHIEPDITAGSKNFDRQVKLWGFQALSQSPWFHPQVNPKGNWLLTSDTMKAQGFPSPDRYLPPMPKPELGTSKTIDNIWHRLMQGEVVEVENNWNIPEVLVGLYKKKGEEYFELDEEYRVNLDDLIFEMEVAYDEFVRKIMQAQAADRLAQQAMGGGMMPAGGSPAGGMM